MFRRNEQRSTVRGVETSNTQEENKICSSIFLNFEKPSEKNEHVGFTTVSFKTLFE